MRQARIEAIEVQVSFWCQTASSINMSGNPLSHPSLEYVCTTIPWIVQKHELKHLKDLSLGFFFELWQVLILDDRVHCQMTTSRHQSSWLNDLAMTSENATSEQKILKHISASFVINFPLLNNNKIWGRMGQDGTG